MRPRGHRQTTVALFAALTASTVVTCKKSAPERGPVVADIMLFDVRSPDGQRSVRVFRGGGRYYFVVDGQRSPSFEDIGIDPPVFSGDNKHLAYVVHRNGRLAVVLDGRESGSFLDIASANAPVYRGGRPQMERVCPAQRCGLVFSPDSKRLAFAAWTGEAEMAVVVDGRSGPVFEQIATVGIYFSPDSKHVAYAGRRASMWHVVVDDILSGAYMQIGDSGLEFSDDWQEVRFRAYGAGGWRTVSWLWSKGAQGARGGSRS
jgi:hypothetical protein